jgi:hypothetical protein
MGDPPKQQIDPATLRIQAEAQADKITAIQERAGADTRDTLIRFGRAKALGAGPATGGAATDNPLTSGAAAGLFAGRKLDLLRGLGRL